MARSFSANVSAWARKSRLRTTAVFRDAVQRTLRDAQTPIAQGGNMPVDTSFLRNSLGASLAGPPRGPSVQAESQGNPDDVMLVIAGAQLGDVIWAGWTAEYARHMEARYGFRESAVQRWSQHVAAAVREAKARFP